MNTEERITRLEESNQELREKVKDLAFRILLLGAPTNVNRMLYEYDLNEQDYHKILDLMDEIRNELCSHREYTFAMYEKRMHEIFSGRHRLENDYHFFEAVARAFFEDRSYQEVFATLYGNMPKYEGLMEDARNTGLYQ